MNQFSNALKYMASMVSTGYLLFRMMPSSVIETTISILPHLVLLKSWAQNLANRLNYSSWYLTPSNATKSYITFLIPRSNPILSLPLDSNLMLVNLVKEFYLVEIVVNLFPIDIVIMLQCLLLILLLSIVLYVILCYLLYIIVYKRN